MLKNRRKGKLGVERLENRLMLDGNVVAKVVGSDLFITGDNADNEVAVFQLSEDVVVNANTTWRAGSVLVVGGTGGGGADEPFPTRINGNGFAVFQNALLKRTSDLFVDLKGGDDALAVGDIVALDDSTDNQEQAIANLLDAIQGLAGGGVLNPEEDVNLIDAAFAVPDDVRIKMGNGDDQVGLQGLEVGSDLTVNTGNAVDGDVVGVFASLVADDVDIDTGNGDDSVGIVDSRIGDDLDIDTNGGDDQLAAVRSEVEDDADIDAGSGDDFVVADGLFVGDTLWLRNGKRGDADQLAGLDTVDAGKVKWTPARWNIVDIV